MNDKSKYRIHFDIVTAHPAMFESVISTSIIKIAREKNLASIHLHNIHDYAEDKYKHIDDTPYGGGAGMIIKCQPMFNLLDKLIKERQYDEIIYATADGTPLKQSHSNEISLYKNVIIIAGHYKGIDQRVRDKYVTREISVGDFVLSGGELPAMIILDSVIRLIPGVLGDEAAALTDSFMDGLLEAPQYTKPAEYDGMDVPDVLLRGNHKEIDEWRLEMSYKKTKERRPDLLDDK